MTPAIELANVTKIYRRYGGRQFATLKSAFLQRSILRDLQPTEVFPALNDVSFVVPAGSTFGVIGRNGSGKSTALKLVAGITKPTTGTVRVNGRISALIELGAGFHPEISGRENVFINGIMLGLSKRQIEQRFDEIVDFAELREFIDAPVKTYSSGMYMRLGFAVAIHVDPEVLLVDEVLAVGDEGFTHKCLDKFAEFRRRGRTILLVTHALGLVERFCDEAVWLDGGRLGGEGDPRRVVDAYLAATEEREEALLAATTAKAVASSASSGTGPGARGPSGAAGPGGAAGLSSGVELGGGAGSGGTALTSRSGPARGTAVDAHGGAAAGSTAAAGDSSQQPQVAGPSGLRNMFQADEGRWGSREIEITDVALVDRAGVPAFVFHSGDAVAIRFKVRAHSAAADFVLGIGLFNAEGVCCYGTNTHLEEMDSEQLVGEAQVTFAIDSLDLVEGTYKLDVAVHKRDGYPYDYHRLLYTFRVKSRTHDAGIYRPHHRWEFSGAITFRPGGQS
jgi:ABC-type polysaccharide/polyol phosphate transport system ATPase subunit